MVKKNLKNKYKNIDDSENEEELENHDNHESDVFTINESYLIIQKVIFNFIFSSHQIITQIEKTSHPSLPLMILTHLMKKCATSYSTQKFVKFW